ncbi:MAG TPA: PHB depolymerase family esterase, partial [Burkholderiaceae bacterium]
MSIHDITNTIDQALTAAGLDTRSGTVKTVMQTIRDALEAARIAQHPKAQGPSNTAHAVDAIDVEARVVVEDEPPHPVDLEQPAAQRGRFLSFVHASAIGHRAYKLYVPASYCSEPMPLVVMLHGCKQDPDDFAAGTRFRSVTISDPGYVITGTNKITLLEGLVYNAPAGGAQFNV